LQLKFSRTNSSVLSLFISFIGTDIVEKKNMHSNSFHPHKQRVEYVC